MGSKPHVDFLNLKRNRFSNTSVYNYKGNKMLNKDLPIIMYLIL